MQLTPFMESTQIKSKKERVRDMVEEKERKTGRRKEKLESMSLAHTRTYTAGKIPVSSP